MAKLIFSALLLTSVLFAGSAPAYSGQAFDDLQAASAGGGRAFDGSRNYAGNPTLAQKAAPELPGQVVTASAADKPAAGKKAWEGVKKAAPYVFVAGVGLWMGVALTGGLALPAIAFAAVIVLLFAAAK